jgi:3-methyladenine DNA glycosylase AlkD
MATSLTAESFIELLKAHSSETEKEKIQRYFKTGPGEYGEGDTFIGIKMGTLFSFAKEFIGMDLKEIEKLLDSPIHEVKAGALSIMDKQARSKKTTPQRRKELYDLYIKKLDRINNWDLVDVSAQYVVGGYLYDKPRDILFRLAKSESMWERRIAIFSTMYFMRQGDLDDTFKIAEMLLNDPQDLIHKVTGWMLREAGRRDKPRLQKYLDKYAATMPRTMLRYSMEHFDNEEREYYMGMKKKAVKLG